MAKGNRGPYQRGRAAAVRPENPFGGQVERLPGLPMDAPSKETPRFYVNSWDVVLGSSEVMIAVAMSPIRKAHQPVPKSIAPDACLVMSHEALVKLAENLRAQADFLMAVYNGMPPALGTLPPEQIAAGVEKFNAEHEAQMILQPANP